MKVMVRRLGRVLGLGLVAGAIPVLLNSCVMAPPASEYSHWGSQGADGFTTVGEAAPPATRASAVAGAPEMAREPAVGRPGLGTTWGEYVSSPMTYTGFERESSRPIGGVATIWYNDREGIDAMTGKSYVTRNGLERSADGLVEWGIKSGYSTLKNYHWSGRRFVVGQDGARYSVVVKNHGRSRLEVVLSVDGLDVLDGKEASVKKRGYIVWPGQTLEVKGWRSSAHQVASFRFSSVGNSYASLKHGDTRNVGVVGMAVFAEKGIDPWNGYSGEAQRRFSASPFAEPPLQRAR